MSIDGFEPEHKRALVSFDEDTAGRFFGAVQRFARLLRVEVHGLEHLPPGRALLVANHAFGWDVMLVMAHIWETTRRPVWVLGEHAWWTVPWLRRLAAAVGTVDGTPENVDTLLAADQLVLVLPGGLREAVKPRDLRYRLLWGRRYGFVRAALRNQAPVVPVASIGPDDFFDFVGNAYRRGERLFRRPGIPLPIPSRILPIPHLERIRYVIGEPLVPPVGPEQALDQDVLRRFRREIAGALHELIDQELALRVGIDLR